MRCFDNQCGCGMKPGKEGTEKFDWKAVSKKQWVALIVFLIYIGFVLVAAFTMEDVVVFSVKMCVATMLLFAAGLVVKRKKK